MKTSKLCSVIFLALVLVLFVAPARATITLTDSNSVVTIDPTSSAGMDSWSVDGTNQLYQQWYWYRVGATGLAQPINNLPLLSVVTALPDQATLSYGSVTGLEIILKITLDGGPVGSGLSDVDTQAQIDNHGTSALQVHFFEYNDFDLNGTPAGQTITLSGTPVNTANQTNGGTAIAEAVVGPSANRWEAALYPTILNGLDTVSGYTLNGAMTAGPGDATWAFEWDKTLGHNGAFLLSKDENLSVVVPEPATIFGMGVILLAVGRKLRKTRV